MQVSRILTYPKNRSIAFSLLRVGLYVVIGLTLYFSFDDQTSYLSSIELPGFNPSIENVLTLLFVLALVPVNWGLEAKKWQLLCKTESLTYADSFKSVLTGLTLNSIVPFGFGSLGARVMTLKNHQRYFDIPGALLGQWIQTAVTLLFGIIGVSVVVRNGGLLGIHLYLAIGIILVLGLIVLFFRSKLAEYSSKFYRAIRSFSKLAWAHLIGLSISRYLVFLMQLVLLIYLFSPGQQLDLMIACATWVFVARTVAPRLSSVETLGVRAAAAWYFLWLANVPFAGTLIAIFCLWLINLFIPAVAGAFWLKRLRWNYGTTLND